MSHFWTEISLIISQFASISVDALTCRYLVRVKRSFKFSHELCCFPADVRPGCGRAGYEQSGSHVPELHCGSSGKHRQVGSVRSGVTGGGIGLLVRWLTGVCPQDHRPLGVQTHRSDRCDRPVRVPGLPAAGRYTRGYGTSPGAPSALCPLGRATFSCLYVPAGVRLYFSTSPFALPSARHTPARPSLLVLIHVRLPPGFSASSTLQKPAKVHKALYTKGSPAPFSDPASHQADSKHDA